MLELLKFQLMISLSLFGNKRNGVKMELFLDTAEVDEVKEIASWGILDGVTTNPSLIKKSGRDFKKVIKEIAEICDGQFQLKSLLWILKMIKEGLN